jgi:hypothetical protein
MRRVALIGMICVLAWCDPGWAGGRPVHPRQDGIVDVVFDILLAPCSLLAECLGVSGRCYAVPPDCRQMLAPPKKISKKQPRQPSEVLPPSERGKTQRKQSTTDLTVPGRQSPQQPPTTQRPLTAPSAPEVRPSASGPEPKLPSQKTREAVPPRPEPVPPSVREQPPPPKKQYTAPGREPVPPAGISETSRRKPSPSTVQVPEKGPVPTGTPPSKTEAPPSKTEAPPGETEKIKQPSVEKRRPGRSYYPPSGCYPQPRCW